MDINRISDEELFIKITELARQDLKDSFVSKEAQYEALGIIADFTKSKLAKFIRQCVKDSAPERLTEKEILYILYDRDSLGTKMYEKRPEEIAAAIHAAQEGKGKK